MGIYHEKRDRTARLLKLQMLLSQHPEGMELAEIAEECSVSPRTVYRDLRTLEFELSVPIWIHSGKYGVAEGHFLPPISFTIEEAMNIFMAARLMQNLSYSYNPSIDSTFVKLNTIIPPVLRQKISNTLAYMKKLPFNERKLNIFNKLTQSWLTQHAVKIHFQEFKERKPVEYIIEPYFIEPSILGHSSFVIAYCRQLKKADTFKIDGIVGDVEILPETFEIPSEFNIGELGSQWDVNVKGKFQTVVLHFNSRVSKWVTETTWHPSQTLKTLKDGSIIMTLKIRDLNYFRAWILGWGDDVEVLKPAALRKQIKTVSSSLQDIYSGREKNHESQ
jgi:predicted DNA-binding transcriptional regulator YafY